MKNELTEKEEFQNLEEVSSFQVQPIDPEILSDRVKYEKLELTPSQKAHIAEFYSHIPAAIASGTMTNAYSVSFPKGMPHALTALKQGGYGSGIQVDGKFVGSASFNPLNTQALALGAFTAMSVVTGQYFLTRIDRELKTMRRTLNDIIKFFYNDKKAELMAEFSFLESVIANSESILQNDIQRQAIVTNLQATKKVAKKNVIFFSNDLNSKTYVHGQLEDRIKFIDEQAKEYIHCYDLSMQLYVVSSVLELFFSENYSESYVSYVENDLLSSINDYEIDAKNVIDQFRSRIINSKIKPYDVKRDEKRKMKGNYIQELEDWKYPYNRGNKSKLRSTVWNMTDQFKNEQQFYIMENGDVYVERKKTRE